MARLTSAPPRLGSAPSRLERVPDAPVARPIRQRDEAPWRSWYKTPRWKQLRLKVLVRDRYTCQRTGEICSGKYPAPNSPTVNHKKPHRGDPALFWDETNLETVTKAVHDGLIQTEEQAALHQRGCWA